MSSHQDPADYPPVDTLKIEEEQLIDPSTGKIDQERIIPHVCKFIVDYINSDVLVSIYPTVRLPNFSSFARVYFLISI